MIRPRVIGGRLYLFGDDKQICAIEGEQATAFVEGRIYFDELLEFAMKDLERQELFNLLDDIQLHLHPSQITTRMLKERT